MKLIFLMFAAFWVVNGDPQLSWDKFQIIRNAHQQCGEEGREFDEDTIKQTIEGSLEEDEKIKQHFFCVGRKLGFVNNDGQFRRDAIKNAIDNYFDNTDEILDRCAVNRGSPEDTAFHFIKCLYQLHHSS